MTQFTRHGHTVYKEMAPITKEDKVLIKGLYDHKAYNALQFMSEFLNKGWTKSSIRRVLLELRQRIARTDEHVDVVGSLNHERTHKIKHGQHFQKCYDVFQKS